MGNEEEAWNDWFPLSVPDRRDVHRHGFNAGQAAGLAACEDMLKIALMEREWLLGAWAAAFHISQADAEAEMLVWSKKWRETALEHER